MDYITLSNGVKMPQLGYGVFQIPSADAKTVLFLIHGTKKMLVA